jgi:hypothetical protein
LVAKLEGRDLRAFGRWDKVSLKAGRVSRTSLSYSGGFEFIFRQGYRLSSSDNFLVLLSPSRPWLDCNAKLGHDRSLPSHNLLISDHIAPWCYIIWNAVPSPSNNCVNRWQYNCHC